MKLFLCSHFSSVGSLIKEEIENKKVAFIPTASLREGYTGYMLFSYASLIWSLVFTEVTYASDLRLSRVLSDISIVG